GDRDEVAELKLDDRPHAADRGANRRPDHGDFGARSIANSLGAELRHETGGHAEGGGKRDIFAHLEHQWVAPHLFTHRLVDCSAKARPGLLLGFRGSGCTEQSVIKHGASPAGPLRPAVGGIGRAHAHTSSWASRGSGKGSERAWTTAASTSASITSTIRARSSAESTPVCSRCLANSLIGQRCHAASSSACDR